MGHEAQGGWSIHCSGHGAIHHIFLALHLCNTEYKKIVFANSLRLGGVVGSDVCQFKAKPVLLVRDLPAPTFALLQSLTISQVVTAPST